MANEVYRIVTAEGHEYDYHNGVEQLKRDHPGAVITGRRVMDDLGQGRYEPYSAPRAMAAERKASASEDATPKAPVKAEAKNDKPAAKTGDEAGKP